MIIKQYQIKNLDLNKYNLYLLYGKNEGFQNEVISEKFLKNFNGELNRYDENYNPLFSYGFGLTYQDEDTLGDDLDESGSSDTNQPILHSIPGLIEAEDYSDMFGIQSETTNDDGGGLNVGYVDEGDWIEYSVDVEESGEYSVEYRLASLNGSSGFELLVDGQQVDVQTIPSTGGWQNWVSETSTVSLEAGEQTIRINAIGALWNLNWLKFTQN